MHISLRSVLVLSTFFMCTHAHTSSSKLSDQRTPTASILDMVAPHLPDSPVILEAGAYDGKDTRLMALKWPNATIHAFEPDPQAFAKLVATTSRINNIHVYEYALGTHNGSAIFHQSEDNGNTWSGSLLEPKEHLNYAPTTFNTTVQVHVKMLDTWAQEYGIDHIDFLWLDMQGFELPAMKAGPTIMNTVKVIYCEVEFVEAYAGQPLYKEVLTWLQDQGFRLIFTDFKEGDPNRWWGNILMVRD